MTWQHTIPDPFIAYHAPTKDLTGIPGEQRYELTFWMPQGHHRIYHPGQKGHLTMLWLHAWAPGTVGTTYEIHQTKRGITTLRRDHRGARPLTQDEFDTMTRIAREELDDYDQPTTRLGRLLEAITGYRRRTRARLQTDLDHLILDTYPQEAGRTIRVQ